MLCATHRLIAAKIYNFLKAELNLELDYTSFLDGSVAPDNTPAMILIPHFRKQSIGFVCKQIDGLINSSIPTDSDGMAEFSFKLGIVVHFISDYFCKAHNDIRYFNPIFHFLYERQLKKYFEKQEHFYGFLGIHKILLKTESIRDFINDKHREYNRKKKNMADDLNYTMEAVTTVTMSIMAAASARTNAVVLNGLLIPKAKTA